MKDKHTETPWVAKPDTNRPDHWLIFGGETQPQIDVADVMPWAPAGTAKANAQLIVRAVNSFDTLMQTRKWLDESLDREQILIKKIDELKCTTAALLEAAKQEE